MSYYASVTASSFFVPTEYTGRVLARMENTPYQFNLDNEGNIITVTCVGYLQGNEFPAFQSIAPYVQDASFVHMSGEEGEQWKYTFLGGVCRIVRPRVCWEDG
jgi:hypothetical protein